MALLIYMPRSRCPNGSRQIPPKSGNCVPNVAKSTLKVNAEHDNESKNPKSKTRKRMTKERQAQIHDLRDHVVKKWNKKSEVYQYRFNKNKVLYVMDLNEDDQKEYAKEYAKKRNVKTGDLLYIDQQRAEHGWKMVGLEKQLLQTEYGGVDIPLKNVSLLKKEHVHYGDILETMKKQYLEEEATDNVDLGTSFWNLVEDIEAGIDEYIDHYKQKEIY